MWFMLSLLFYFFLLIFPFCSAWKLHSRKRTFGLLISSVKSDKYSKREPIFWVSVSLFYFIFPAQTVGGFSVLNGHNWLRRGEAACRTATWWTQPLLALFKMCELLFFLFALLVIRAASLFLVSSMKGCRLQASKLLRGRQTLNSFHTCCCLLVASTLFICFNPPQPLLY